MRDVTGCPSVVIRETAGFAEMRLSTAALGTLRWRTIRPMQRFLHEGRTWAVVSVSSSRQVVAEPLHQFIDRHYIGGWAAYLASGRNA